MSTRFNEEAVEAAALAWLEVLGRTGLGAPR